MTKHVTFTYVLFDLMTCGLVERVVASVYCLLSSIPSFDSHIFIRRFLISTPPLDQAPRPSSSRISSSINPVLLCTCVYSFSCLSHHFGWSFNRKFDPTKDGIRMVERQKGQSDPFNNGAKARMATALHPQQGAVEQGSTDYRATSG